MGGDGSGMDRTGEMGGVLNFVELQTDGVRPAPGDFAHDF